MKKFFRFNTTLQGYILVCMDYYSGIATEGLATQLWLNQIDDTTLIGSSVVVLGNGAGFGDIDSALEVIENRLSRLYSSGYTKSYIDVEFPGVVVDSVAYIVTP